VARAGGNVAGGMIWREKRLACKVAIAELREFERRVAARARWPRLVDETEENIQKISISYLIYLYIFTRWRVLTCAMEK
jgi:hypothetical protein